MAERQEFRLQVVGMKPLSEIVERLIGRALLRAAVSYGDELHLDFYRPGFGHREFILATSVSPWELVRSHGSTIVSSSDPKIEWVARLEAAIGGQSIRRATITPTKLGLEIHFGGCDFRILPGSDDPEFSRWELTGPADQELVVGPGDRWTWGPAQ